MDNVSKLCGIQVIAQKVLLLIWSRWNSLHLVLFFPYLNGNRQKRKSVFQHIILLWQCVLNVKRKSIWQLKPHFGCFCVFLLLLRIIPFINSFTRCFWKSLLPLETNTFIKWLQKTGKFFRSFLLEIHTYVRSIGIVIW